MKDHTDPTRGFINPRLSDVFDLVIRQDQVDFVVPHLKDDLPLYLDPFLLWMSDNPEYKALHALLLDFVDEIRKLALGRHDARAQILLSGIREPDELGLGYAAGSKRGSAIGQALAKDIVSTFKRVPQLSETGLDHIEVLALLIPKIAEDRISDLTATVIKHWLAKFTTERCLDYQIPTKKFRFSGSWSSERHDWVPFDARLPFSPIDESPVLLAPLNLLRRLPWINYEDYYRNTYSRLVLSANPQRRAAAKPDVLAYNRANFEQVRNYVASRESSASQCSPDPLFKPLRLDTLRRKMAEIRSLPTGRTDGADKRFEALAFDILSSLLYPELDLAADQVRTISGAHIRDVIFHNDSKTAFLRDLREQYGARQVVFELKNVRTIETDHINQLYRYLDQEEIGRFGLILGRYPAPRNVMQNTVDLHSSKRNAVLCLNDTDLELMVQLLASNRRPIEALRKKYVEFTRLLPR